MKDYEEWSKDVSFCDLNSFKSYVKDMSDMLFEEFGAEELLGNYFNWFSKRLSNNRKM